MKVVTRFAPSPTGYLHVGNVRTALVNWLFARACGGKFILRIDDTDRERSKQEYVDGILRDLEWLGLYWDEIYYQSKRADLHEAAKQKMVADGRLYPCFETAEELELKKKTALSRNLPPIYDRAALKLTAEQKAELGGRIPPHYRFLMEHKAIFWNDGVKGRVHFEGKNISDPVLVRADGSMTYMISSVVDDIDLCITDIIRGEDHITNSAVHIQMFEALGAAAPNLSHLALLQVKDGKMSKRVGGFDIGALREAGMHPMAINSFLAKIGTSAPVEFRHTLEDLIKEFDLSTFSKSPTSYELGELERLNAKLTHNMGYEEVRPFLPAHITEGFWYEVRANLETFHDVTLWWDICNHTSGFASVDPEFTREAARLLPLEPWNEDTWKIWSANVSAATGRKGRELFMPLRIALTGQEHGPELGKLLPLLGRQMVMKRLNTVN